MSTQKISSADILSEFFEVLVHNIIYQKKIYPDTIFTAKKKYGILVYQSIHPDVNEYINQCMKAVNFHARKKQLKRLFLCFHSDQAIFEKYVFEVLHLSDFVEEG
ncbi:unnamed protein product [Phaedon cochleariae]|uniref:HORMA domain-containing protein n=1 Tax=Phaedon cochleariae TaxID=80249 RepID=A0A9N9SCG6_PHACE|nr:unnamed protein product [Phaedon cochleariae]